MSFENTLNRFKLISGLSDEEAVKWLPILRESVEYVKTLVTKEDLSDYDRIRLDNAAGVNGYYRYITYSLETQNSFSAGDIQVNVNKDKVKDAQLMWQTEMSALNDIIDCSPFTFRRVR